MKTKIFVYLVSLFWVINAVAVVPAKTGDIKLSSVNGFSGKDYPGVEYVSSRDNTGTGENSFIQQAVIINPFNGKDLTGWGSRIKTPDGVIFESLDGKTESKDKRFSGKGGIITINPWVEANGERWVNLWTAKEFPKDFTLTLEFRASKGADSGIFLRGKQLQCRDYLLMGPYKNLKNYKEQDWNKIEVVVKNNVAHCTCNGEIIEEAYILPATGPIGFEADQGQMEYRNIQVKELE
jgi:hypothetical protein